MSRLPYGGWSSSPRSSDPLLALKWSHRIKGRCKFLLLKNHKKPYFCIRFANSCDKSPRQNHRKVSMLEKLKAIKDRWEGVERELSNPDAINDMKRYARLNKE